MRVLVAPEYRLDADFFCSSAGEAKRVLNEEAISRLLLVKGLPGREHGLDLLRWANHKNRLPGQVTVIDPNPMAKMELGEFLLSVGYRSADARNYFKMPY